MAKAIPSAAALDLAGEPALTVATGDSVMVDSGSAVPYIGHVKALFSRLDGVQKAKWRVEEDTGPFMLLQWYYRDSDLPARLRGRSVRSAVHGHGLQLQTHLPFALCQPSAVTISRSGAQSQGHGVGAVRDEGTANVPCARRPPSGEHPS